MGRTAVKLPGSLQINEIIFIYRSVKEALGRTPRHIPGKFRYPAIAGRGFCVAEED
jgi:hypothetical protein